MARPIDPLERFPLAVPTFSLDDVDLFAELDATEADSVVQEEYPLAANLTADQRAQGKHFIDFLSQIHILKHFQNLIIYVFESSFL